MRKILCLLMPKLNTALMDECAQHSFLVEPLNDQELLLDLSSFNKISSIVDRISKVMAIEGNEAVIGLAASPLLARLAAHRSILPVTKERGCRCLSRHGVKIVQIPAGKEAEFLEKLPVTEFLPLSSREQKLLMRRGYSSIGELKCLNPSQMRQLLRRDTMLLWQNLQGLDYTPVRGIYPADRISYTCLLPDGCSDYIRLQEVCREASQFLAQELEHRHVGFHHIRLEIITEPGSQLGERKVSQSCYDAIRLGNILLRLLPSDITAPVEEIRVFLHDLESLQMKEMNLFTQRQEIQLEQRHIKRLSLLEQLQIQYPDSLQLGLSMDRRDQILALWDPWRISWPVKIQE